MPRFSCRFPNVDRYGLLCIVVLDAERPLAFGVQFSQEHVERVLSLGDRFVRSAVHDEMRPMRYTQEEMDEAASAVEACVREDARDLVECWRVLYY